MSNRVNNDSFFISTCCKVDAIIIIDFVNKSYFKCSKCGRKCKIKDLSEVVNNKGKGGKDELCKHNRV